MMMRVAFANWPVWQVATSREGVVDVGMANDYMHMQSVHWVPHDNQT